MWITDQKTEGTVNKETAERSYQVTTLKGTIRRNRKHLIVLLDTNVELPDTNTELKPQSKESSKTVASEAEKIVTTRSGRTVRMPERYKD